MSVYRPRYKDKKTGEKVESEIWWYDFIFAGKRYRGSTDERLKTLAGIFEKRMRRELEEMHANGPQPKKDTGRFLRTVSEALKAYREAYETGHREKSVSWVKERTAHVERILGSAILMNVTEGTIRDYIEKRLEEGVSNRTVNMEVLCLSRAVGRTWRELWPSVPRLQENEDVGRALDPDEEQALLSAAAKNRSPIIDRFIRIALSSAMRSGEIRTLQVQSINFREDTIRVGRAKSNKGTGRVIPMNADLRATIIAQIEWLRKHFGTVQPDWYLFPFFADGWTPQDPTRPVTTIHNAWETVREKAGVQCRFHDLRHTAITKLAETGVPDSTMKALAGHVHEKMLERYSHIRMAAKRNAVEALALPKAVGLKTVPKENPKVRRSKRILVMPETPVSR